MKILLFSRDPGGTNGIIPLIEPFVRAGHDVDLWGKDSAIHRYQSLGYMGRDIALSGHDLTLPAGYRSFLLQGSYDRIVTGTSADDNTEKYLWRAARELSIPSFAIVDQWMMVGIRFSKFDTRQVSEYEREKDVSFLPHRILVTDSSVALQALECGNPGDIVMTTGHPHFDWIRAQALSIGSAKVAALRSKLLAEKATLVVFASEPFSQVYDDSVGYWGFSEMTILTHLLRAMRHTDTKLVIRPHPKEAASKFDELLEGANNAVVDQTTRSLELIVAADLVCGMSSMFLVEAAVLNRPVMSIQIGLKQPDACVLTRTGVIRPANDPETLRQQLELVLNGQDLYLRQFEPPPDSINTIVNTVLATSL